MNKKIIYSLLILLLFLLLVSGILFFSSGPSADTKKATLTQNKQILLNATSGERIEIKKELSSLEFEGFGPGKSHIGTFNNFEVKLIQEDGQIVGFEGEIDASSVDTGIEKLDNHLKSDDFFDVEKYPKIFFKSNSISEDKTEITGILTFHGVTHEITIPTKITENSLESDFLLDTTPFNIKYTGINKEVKITYKFII